MAHLDSINSLAMPSLKEKVRVRAPKPLPAASRGDTAQDYLDRPVKRTPKGPITKVLLWSLAVHAAVLTGFAGWKLSEALTPHEFVAVAVPPPPPREIRVKLEQRSLVKPTPVRVTVVTSSAPPKVEFALPELPRLPPPPPELKFRGEATALNLPQEVPIQPTSPVENTPALPTRIGSEGSAGYVGTPRLDYPAAARRLGLEGRCVLQLTIGADGELRDLVLAVSSGHKLLDEAAQRCARESRYYAAQLGTEKIQSVVEWPFVFKLTQ